MTTKSMDELILAEQKKLAEYDEKSKELMEQMHSQVDTDKGTDAESEEEATEKITEYLANHSETGSLEYLVRGATLVCRNGSHKRRINLKKCHGVYIGSHPLIHELDCVPGDNYNIAMFGVCQPTGGPGVSRETVSYVKTEENSRDGSSGTVTGEKCTPVIIGVWQDTYPSTRIVDNGLKNPEDRARAWSRMETPCGEATVTCNSFLVCKYGGLIEPIDSGQNVENEDEHVCDGETGQTGAPAPHEHQRKTNVGLSDFPEFYVDGKMMLGGNQRWFKNEAWYSGATQDDIISKCGCGLIAVGNLLLSLSMQDKKYETAFTDIVKPDTVNGGYNYESYKNYIYALNNVFSPVVRNFGLNGFLMAKNINNYSDQFDLGLSAKWGGVKGDEMITKMAEMLDNDLPVILCIGPKLGFGEREGVDFYVYNKAKGKYENSGTVNNHYITILGIEDSWDNPPRTMLRLSSWGKEYLIYYDDYISYANEQLDDYSFCNMLYITKE